MLPQALPLTFSSKVLPRRFRKKDFKSLALSRRKVFLVFGAIRPKLKRASMGEVLPRKLPRACAHSGNHFSEVVAGRFPRFLPYLINFPLALILFTTHIVQPTENLPKSGSLFSVPSIGFHASRSAPAGLNPQARPAVTKKNTLAKARSLTIPAILFPNQRMRDCWPPRLQLPQSSRLLLGCPNTQFFQVPIVSQRPTTLDSSPPHLHSLALRVYAPWTQGDKSEWDFTSGSVLQLGGSR